MVNQPKRCSGVSTGSGLSVGFASHGGEHLLSVCSSGHVRPHAVSSPLEHHAVLQGGKRKVTNVHVYFTVIIN